MNIKKVTGAMFDTNSYILWNETEAALIDCGEDAHLILKAVEQTGMPLKTILLTHGHFDHILTCREIKECTGASIVISKEDSEKTCDGKKNLAAVYGIPLKEFKADRLLSDGDVFSICGEQIRVILTPGHTEGSVCFLAGEHLFCGDTLFKGTIGRFERENKAIMKASVKRLLQLPDDTAVYPGHGDASTIKFEKQHNPFADFDWEWE